jgi:serine/threonine protein kinase
MLKKSAREENPLKGKEDKFRLDKILGRGSFGLVYSVTRRADGAKFALKQVEIQDEAHQKIFIGEIAATSKLDHINVVRLEDYWIGSELMGSLLLEWCDSDLDKVLKMARRMTSVKDHNKNPFMDKNGEGLIILEDYFTQALQGLSYVHSSGVIHSDIKPDNIFLKEVDGREVLKFGDFGMAKFGFGSKLLASKLVGGSPAYQPPEIRDGTVKPGPSTDIYSLGITIWQLATLDYPDHSTTIELTENFANEAIQKTVNQMLRQNPAHRPLAADLLRTLQVMLELNPLEGSPCSSASRKEGTCSSLK